MQEAIVDELLVGIRAKLDATLTDRSRLLADIRARVKAEDRYLTLDEIELVLPEFSTTTEELEEQLLLLRTYIDDHDVELKAARLLRDRDIGRYHRQSHPERVITAEVSGTSVPHVAGCIGGRTPGAHL